MAKKTTKKVDMKKVAKLAVSEQVRALFASQGIVVEDGLDFGFTEGTLVLRTDKCDVQVKLITPKAGIDRYEKLEDEVEEEETQEEEQGE